MQTILNFDFYVQFFILIQIHWYYPLKPIISEFNFVKETMAFRITRPDVLHIFFNKNRRTYFLSERMNVNSFNLNTEK